MFEQTIEVFNKIAQKIKEERSPELGFQRIEYFITEKQYLWLVRTYCKEDKDCKWDGRCGVGFTDDEGNQYSFSPKNFWYNVSHYIPDREKYGKRYFIVKYIKQEVVNAE